MANDMTGVNDIYKNGLNDVYAPMPTSQNLLPKTGHTISYQSGDDGDYQAGLSTPETRFEVKSISGGSVVVDHHTGLMWVQSKTSAVCNNGAKLEWSFGITFNCTS